VIKGFKDFISRGNIVDLAVAVVVGTAFTALVNALVKDLLTPLIAAIIGKPSFSSLTFTINNSQFNYGSFINALITFLSVAAAVYFFVVVPLNKLAERRGGRKGPEPTEEVVLLGEIRDLLAAGHNGAATESSQRREG
jgi:large conductance mechanosensitive channel